MALLASHLLAGRHRHRAVLVAEPTHRPARRRLLERGGAVSRWERRGCERDAERCRRHLPRANNLLHGASTRAAPAKAHPRQPTRRPARPAAIGNRTPGVSLIPCCCLVVACGVLQLYIVEESCHSLARQLLLLSLFADSALPPRERLETFLDAHHNALIQQRTAAHVADSIEQLTQQLNTEAAAHHYTPAACRPYSVDLSALKRKELDAVMQQLDFIASAPPAAFDVSSLLDARWRYYYGERYDSRQNLVDADYHTRLKLVAPVYHVVHFRRWRTTGQAYEKRDCTYDTSNRSLASTREAKAKGRGAVEVRGYWGDVVVGPSVVYGVDSADEASYEMRQNQHVHTAVDLSEATVGALMAAAGECTAGGEAPRVSFHFVQGTLATLAGRSRFRRLFHRAFVSHFQYAQLASLPALLAGGASGVPLTLDTLYYWPLKEEEKRAAQDKLREKVVQSGGGSSSAAKVEERKEQLIDQ